MYINRHATLYLLERNRYKSLDTSNERWPAITQYDIILCCRAAAAAGSDGRQLAAIQKRIILILCIIILCRLVRILYYYGVQALYGPNLIHIHRLISRIFFTLSGVTHARCCAYLYSHRILINYNNITILHTRSSRI